MESDPSKAGVRPEPDDHLRRAGAPSEAPASTVITCPVTSSAPSISHTTAAAISSGFTRRLSGVELAKLVNCASYFSGPRWSCHQRPPTIAGHTTLARISGPRLRASDKVMMLSPALEVA